MKQQGSIFSKIAVPIAILAIVVYLIYSAWVGIRDPYQFTVAYSDTMETSVNATGWVVRSDQPVAGVEGLVQLKRSQGEKVAKGKEIAVVYQDETYVENQEELLQVKRRPCLPSSTPPMTSPPPAQPWRTRCWRP